MTMPGHRRGPRALRAKVDRRPYTIPRKNPKAVPERDWGKRWTASTMLSYGPDIGVLIGGARTLTVYGFRKDPYASRHEFRAAFATGPMSYRLEYRGEFRRENSGIRLDLLARASGIDVISFSGFGNENPAPGNSEFYRVTQDAYRLQPSLVFALGSRATMRLGPVLKYVSTDDRPDRFLATLGDLYGTGNFGELGGGLTLALRQPRPAGPRPQGTPPRAGWGRISGDLGRGQHLRRGPRRGRHLSLDQRAAGPHAGTPGGRTEAVGTVSLLRRSVHRRRFDRAARPGKPICRGRVSLRIHRASAFPREDQAGPPGSISEFLVSRMWAGSFSRAKPPTPGTRPAAGECRCHSSSTAYTLSLAIAESEERTGIYVQGGFAF